MDPTLSEIRIFAGNFAPLSWAFCNGRLMSIAENTALFSLLGTTYGGDGQTTFALPDLRSRIPIGTGQGAGLSYYDLGEVSGTEGVTLMSSQLPMHTHPSVMGASGTTGNAGTATGAVLGVAPANTYASGSPTVAMGNGAVQLALTGGSQPHNNVMPVLALNYIIAVEGIYPSRN